MDTRQTSMPPTAQLLGLPVLNPEGVFLGTVHAIMNDAVPGREPCVVIAHAGRDGGHRLSGFLMREFECRRHGIGYFLVLPVFAETMDLLPGMDPALLLRDRAEPRARSRAPWPLRRRPVPVMT
jgi:hypothetical protein